MLGFGAIGELAIGQFESEAANASNAGVFTITGQDVGLFVGRVLTAEVGVFTITGGVSLTAQTRAGLRVIAGGGARGLKATAGGGGKGLRIRA